MKPFRDWFRLKLARGTSAWLAVSWLVTAVLGALSLYSLWFLILLVPSLFVSLVLLNFFRDPEREIARGVCASADGVITLVEETEDGGHRIVTFMNPLNVHVNRAPLAARVATVQHFEGGFIPAWNKDSDRNERVVWDLDTEIGPVRVVQIAGALARRIVPYLGPGEKVMKGERIGIIRLGSRVDVYLPAGPKPAVKVGDKVRAGETTLATLP